MDELVNEYIRRIDLQLQTDPNSSSAGGLVRETVSTFIDEIPTIKHELNRYRPRIICPGSPEPVYNNEEDLNQLKGKLRVYLEKQKQQNHEKDAININTTVNPTISTTATSSASTQTDISVAIKKAVEQVKQDDALDLETKERIQELLDIARGSLGRKSPSFIDKAFDALRLAARSLPTFLSILQALAAIGSTI